MGGGGGKWRGGGYSIHERDELVQAGVHPPIRQQAYQMQRVLLGIPLQALPAVVREDVPTLDGFVHQNTALVCDLASSQGIVTHLYKMSQA